MKSKHNETLADLLLEVSYMPSTPKQWPPDLLVNARNRLRAARRFVLDKNASTFLSDLSNAVFMGKKPKISERIFNQMLMLARLPHSTTWLEYDAAAEGVRTRDLIRQNKEKFADGDHTSDRTYEERTFRQVGLLARVTPECETIFKGTIFMRRIINGMPVLAWFPFEYVWSTEGDLVFPYSVIIDASNDVDNVLPGKKFIWESIAGFRGVNKSAQSFRMLSIYPHEGTDLFKASDAILKMTSEVLEHFPGLFRRFLALLATINDIPVISTNVRRVHGFMARHSYYRYLDHTVLTLNLPKGGEPYKIARNIVAAAHRRAHEVRGHWRRHHWQPEQRIWIHEHFRGDRRLGMVTHDYNIVHEEKTS